MKLVRVILTHIIETFNFETHSTKLTFLDNVKVSDNPLPIE